MIPYLEKSMFRTFYIFSILLTFSSYPGSISLQLRALLIRGTVTLFWYTTDAHAMLYRIFLFYSARVNLYGMWLTLKLRQVYYDFGIHSNTLLLSLLQYRAEFFLISHNQIHQKYLAAFTRWDGVVMSTRNFPTDSANFRNWRSLNKYFSVQYNSNS